ncbi:MAG: hypothetical protein HY657_02060 [Acidobacteria bacterium]|nr:hypothetical protein [Acidobacteriota bacterium]
MDPELERVLQGFKEAAEFAKTFRFELTEEYLAQIAYLEALPENQSGVDKSHVWRGLRAYRETFKHVRAVPRKP